MFPTLLPCGLALVDKTKLTASKPNLISMSQPFGLINHLVVNLYLASFLDGLDIPTTIVKVDKSMLSLDTPRLHLDVTRPQLPKKRGIIEESP